MQVSFDVHQLAQQGRITSPVELRNVVAILPGRSARRIYITAHYDTVNIGPEAQIGALTQPPGVTRARCAAESTRRTTTSMRLARTTMAAAPR